MRKLVGTLVLGLSLFNTTTSIAENKGKVHLAYGEWASNGRRHVACHR